MKTRAPSIYPVYLPDHRYSPPIYRAYLYAWVLGGTIRQYANDPEDFSRSVALYGGEIYNTTSWQWGLYKMKLRNADSIERKFANATKRLEKKARQ